ncbi:DUF6538 domain-containing protein [Marinobacter orientalis]|uniref:Tyrosine-type recombinase/integrase n=1 Tax=Marinobacter orientalis TaxID=1928859 RepID=A0A7Y0WS17_9GAMM|nr:DUF6538 domain-containing protein [Marinobacter orientalis]NMT63548.1 tyrosine-type recombinase/integrase [Marinobacter orientalis]TGX48604.1 hypothetical protein DIT72_14545 [Marinobacter orientalis]
MIVKLGYALSIKTKYLQKRGNIYQFVMRVPTELVTHYGKRSIRHSLKTDELTVAMHKAERFARTYKAEFVALSQGNNLTPRETMNAAARMAERYLTLDSFVDAVAEPKRQAYAGQCWETYEHAPVEEFLTPVEQEALKRLQNPKELRLSRVFTYYEQQHKKANDSRFIERCQRYWNKFVEVVGDIPFSDLKRMHVRTYIDHRLADGMVTGTVRRELRQLRAIAQMCITETEMNRPNPFSSVSIPNEGKDAKDKKVPTDTELMEIASRFLNDPSPTAVIILMQMETGTRVGEISGLKLSDVVLDHEVPHINLQDNEWRTLKNDSSARLVPLVGVALHAAKRAVAAHAGGHEALFPNYAKPRGNDTASAATNKRLKAWAITSHCFRHAMIDRLRNADVTKDARGAIVGHGKSDTEDDYGKGRALRKKQEALQQVAIPVDCLSSSADSQ